MSYSSPRQSLFIESLGAALADHLFSLLIDILNILFYALTYLRISLVSHMYILYFVMTIIIYLAGYGDGNPSPPAFIGGDTEVSS